FGRNGMPSMSLNFRAAARTVPVIGVGIALVRICVGSDAPTALPEPRIAWIRQTPLVITPATTDVTIEAAIEGKFDRAQLYVRASKSLVPLNDAGHAGDQSPDDGVYSLRIDAGMIRGGMEPADVFRADVGTIRLEGEKVGERRDYPLTANVWTGAIPRVEI